MKRRVALVTGSSTCGIGLGIVKKLAAQGMITIMHGIESEDEIKNIARDVEGEIRLENTSIGSPIMVSGVSGDLRNPEQMKAMVDKIGREHGGIDVLCNNAGIQCVNEIETFPGDKWQEILDVVLSAPFYLTKYVLPHMQEKGWGRIINTGSMHSLVASPYKSAYNAAKHGIAGFTKTVALEMAPKEADITVNCVCPGYSWTELIRKQMADQARTRGITEEEVVERVLLCDQPIKRFVHPNEVGALVAFLCSDDSSAITGACLSIDGGWTAR